MTVSTPSPLPGYLRFFKGTELSGARRPSPTYLGPEVVNCFRPVEWVLQGSGWSCGCVRCSSGVR